MIVALILYLTLGLSGSQSPFNHSSVYGDYPMMLQRWTIDDGLPVNTLLNIIQAKDGYIWFTTYDGLIRFDGIQFTNFNSTITPGLASNRLLQLFEDKENRIWITSENGYLIYYDKGEFKSFKFGNPESSPLTWAVLQDKKGGIWIGADDGLYHFNNGVISQVYQNSGDRSESITGLYEHSDGTIIATSKSIIHIVRNNVQHRIFMDFIENTTHFVRAIHEEENGEILIGTSNGVFKIYPGSVEERFENTPTKNSPIRVIKRTFNGSLLIAYDGGVYLEHKDGKTENFPIVCDLTDNHVKKYFVDHLEHIWLIKSAGNTLIYDGNLLREGPFFDEFVSSRLESIIQDKELNYWAATQFGGLLRLKSRKVFNFTNVHGLSHHNISGVTQSPDGCIWAGTLDLGVNRICNGIVTTFNRENSELISNNVRTVEHDRNGNIYIGHFHAGYDILRTDGSFINVQDTTSFSRNQINSFWFEENGDIWIGTNGGIKHISNGSSRYITSSDGLPHNFVRYITRDGEGHLWIATNGGGIAKKTADGFQLFNASNGLGSNSIRSIYPDPFIEGAVWVGSEDRGLSLIHNDTITRFTTEHGLFDNVIHKILEDDQNRLWMSTNRGIFFVKKDELLRFARGEVRFIKSISFTQDEGMYNPEANGGTQQAGLLTSSGELVFPSQNGLVYLYPSNISLNSTPPFVHIESLIADGIEYATTSDISLPAGVRNIEIRYTGISLTSPSQNQFMTKLHPTEREFINSGSRRNRFFTFMKPGSYTFYLQASNNHGFWTNEPIKLSFNVQPFFWQTKSFYAITLLMILLLLYSGYRVRFNMLEKRKEKLELLIDERTKELQVEKENALEQKRVIEDQAIELHSLNQTKDKFFSIIAHDLRGAFHGIHGLSGLMSEEAEALNNENLKLYSDTIHNTSNHVNELLKNLLSWARLQSKHVNVNFEKINLNDLVNKNLNLYNTAIKGKEIQVRNKLTKHVLISSDRNMTDLVIRNLISNAVKFCQNSSVITIEEGIETNSTHSLIISDTGVGMTQDKLNDIFKFSASKSTRGTQDEPGSGLGLNLCYELMHMVNGEITVKSEVGKGTSFTLTFLK